jgi:P27 family predicted phage terminase small subunit
MARRREPVNLVLMKGKANLTKEEVETRRAQEVVAKADNVRPPAYLPKELHLEFKRIATELKRIELIANLDTDTLARFILARGEYNRTMELLRSIDPADDIMFYNKVADANNKFFQQCRNSANDLGLNISSRCRLLVPKAKTKEPSEFDSKFGNV